MARVPEWTLAERLRKARLSAGLEQAELAERLGAARNTVINYENGHTKPKPYLVMAWATITDVPVDWLNGVTHGYQSDWGMAA